MGLPSDSGSHAGCKDRGDGGINWEAAENGGSVHSHQEHDVNLTGGGETPRGNGSTAVARSASTVDCGSVVVRGDGYG